MRLSLAIGRSDMKNVVAIDLETDGLHRGCQIKSVAYWDEHGGDVFPFDNPEDVRFVQVMLDIANPEKIKVFHNAQFDVRVLREHGITIRGPVHCTYTMAALLFPRDVEEPRKKAELLGLKHLSRKYLDDPYIEEERLLAWLKKNKLKKADMYRAPEYLLHPYNLKDAQCTWGLFYLFSRQLRRIKMVDTYRRDMATLLGPVMDMERVGLPVDRARCKKLQVEAIHEMLAIKKKLGFNPNSARQVAEHVFRKAGVPVKRWTKGGKRSGPMPATDELALWEAGTEQANNVIAFKKATGANTRYLAKILKGLDDNDRVHCSIKVAGAKTGRMSILEPPLQQLPRPSSLTAKTVLQRVRSVFRAPEGSFFLFADYSQIELRLAAHYSKEEWMVKAFCAGRDIHDEACIRYFKYPKGTEEFKKYRPITKNLNFAMQYGARAVKLHSMFMRQAHLFVPIAKCAEYQAIYIARNPRMMALFQSVAQEITLTGGVRNCYGRFVPVDADASYRGVNYLIQGTAADICKDAMRRIYAFIRKNKLRTKMLLQIHDELMFQIPDEERWIIPTIAQLMIPETKFDVPITVSLNAGVRWTTKKEITPAKLNALAKLRVS